MLHYILQTILFQLVFLVVYDIFLKKETFFNWNRAYLLVTSIASFSIPLIKINSFKAIVPEAFVINLPAVILGESSLGNTVNIAKASQAVSPSFWSWQLVLSIGMLVAFTITLFKVLKVYRLITKNSKRWKHHFWLVNLKNSKTAFSFFNYICLGDRLDENDRQTILEHELVHVKQKHSLDLLFFEILRIVFWFNPLLYIYQKRVSTLHEYIADAEAIKYQDKTEYYQNLLTQIFDTKKVSFVNTFYKKSLIKKRVIMLSKNRSKQKNAFKYLVLLPLVCCMLMYTSSYAQETKELLSDSELKEKMYLKLLDMKSNGEDFFAISEHFMPKNDVYIQSKEDFFKFQVYTRDLMKNADRSKWSKDFKEKMDKDLNKSYEDYLAFKKTDKSKEIWESQTRRGVLRMVVRDFKNKSEEEERVYQFKKKLLFEDKDIHTFVVTDGVTTTTIKSSESKGNAVKNNSTEIPFSVIDQIPLFPGCETVSKETQKECTTNKIARYVNKNFNIKIAKTLKLKGKQRIIAAFKINKEGHVIDVRVRAPHPGLEVETKRVLESLPQMIPGEHNGKAVIVPYSLPITFQIHE